MYIKPLLCYFHRSDIFIVSTLLCCLKYGCILSAEEKPVDFNTDVAPLLQTHCVSCHGAELEMGDYRLDIGDYALDEDVVTPGNSSNSIFIKRLSESKSGIRMPPTGPELSKAQKQVLSQWIDQGATWPDGVELIQKNSGAIPENTPLDDLLTAIRDGKPKIIKKILQSKPDLLKQKDEHGYTPLHYAAYFSNARIVNLLMYSGADIESKTPRGFTALSLALQDIKKCDALINAGAEVNPKTNNGKTPLMIASSRGMSSHVIRSLVKAGADTNALDNKNQTSLESALQGRHIENAKLLLKLGADPKLVGNGAWTKVPELAKQLGLEERLYQKNQLTAFIRSSINEGNIGNIHYIAEHSDDALRNELNSKNHLFRAVYREHSSLDMVQALIKYGANKNWKDDRHLNLLDWAAMKGNTPITDYLSTFLEPTKAGKQPNDQEVTEERPIQKHSKNLNRQEMVNAIESGIIRMQRSNIRFFQRSGCIACHQQVMTSMITTMAKYHGLKYKKEEAKKQTKIYEIVLRANRDTYLRGGALPGNQDTTSRILFGLNGENYPADANTDAMVAQLMTKQNSDGRWHVTAHRPPSEYSDISNTAFAIQAIQAYAPPGLKKTALRSIQKARQYLNHAQPEAMEDHIGKLLGLRWAEAKSSEIQKAGKALLALQRSDGGWSQLPTLSSDAYATGFALFALREGMGLRKDHEAVQKGIIYLLSIQLDDGSWHVRGRSDKFQPFFESGFPHGEDQWISAQATGWSLISLLKYL
ncbi:ankyrin repeat domain-containing protein [bacterium]|nr:ankyrin repeat domain-containing protein [bacterium]